MSIIIEKANATELAEIEKLYNDICDYLADKEYNPGWRKGCFPTKEDALMFLKQDALYVAKEDGKIVGSVALTHSPNAEANEDSKYDETEYADILFVHILVVHPEYHRKGIGTKLLDFAERFARKMAVKSIRLYLYEKNYVAINSYENNGYMYLEKVDIGLGEFGLDWFCLYEKAVEEFFMDKTELERLHIEYKSFLQKKKEEMGADSQEFLTFKKAFAEDFQRGIANNKIDRKILIQGERLTIREACIEDSDFMSNVERDVDNSPWVANWPLGWRVARFGDADFLQVIIEREDGTPIGFIIFRDMLNKEKQIQLKRIAIIDKGKGYGKEALYLVQKLAFEVFGTKRLYLWTKEENLRAQSIYKATGFVPDMPDPCVSFHMNRADYEV